jgi:hypothetical protein
MGYRLKKDGQMVYVSRTSKLMLDGTYTHLTKAEVGHAGKVYEDLPDFVTEEIHAGKKEDIWEIVSTEELQGTTQTTETVELSEESKKTTGGKKQTIIERSSSETSSSETDESPEDHEHSTDFAKMSNDDLTKLIRDHNLTISGTGAGGNILHRDLVKTLEDAHPHPHEGHDNT